MGCRPGHHPFLVIELCDVLLQFSIKANSVTELGGTAFWASSGMVFAEPGSSLGGGREEGSHNFCQQFWTAEADTLVK